jgi:hypothetical protein
MHTPEATTTTRRRRLIASTLIAGTFATAMTIGTATARAETPQWLGTVIEDRHSYNLDGWQTINNQNINCPSTAATAQTTATEFATECQPRRQARTARRPDGVLLTPKIKTPWQIFLATYYR